MKICPLNLITTILNRLSTQVELEAEAEVEEDKEVAKAKTLNKASNKMKKLMV